MFVALQSCPRWLKSLVGLCSRQPQCAPHATTASGQHLLPLLGWPEAEGPLQRPLPCLHGLPLPSVMVEVPVFARQHEWPAVDMRPCSGRQRCPQGQHKSNYTPWSQQAALLWPSLITFWSESCLCFNLCILSSPHGFTMIPCVALEDLHQALVSASHSEFRRTGYF